MSEYHCKYGRKRRQDEEFRKKEADRNREYRKFKKVAELKMEDEFSIMEAKVERLQRKVDQFDEFLILLFQNEGSKDSFEEDHTQSDSVEEPMSSMSGLVSKVRQFMEKTELFHRLCGLERCTFNDLVNDLEVPFKQLTWRGTTKPTLRIFLLTLHCG
jgi:hypothetical protein